MTTPQIVAAVLAVLTLLACWLYLRATRRRKVSEQSTLDRAVREERHLSLVLDDPTDEPLEVDPLVVPRYARAETAGVGWYRVVGGYAFDDGRRMNVDRIVWAGDPDSAVNAATHGCQGARELPGLGGRVWPCPACCCVICGKPTPDAPECLDCFAEEDSAARRRADR